MPKRRLVLRIEGRLENINKACEVIGSFTNDVEKDCNIKIEF